MCQGLCLGLRFKGKNRHRHNLLMALTGEGSRKGSYQINNPIESKVIL